MLRQLAVAGISLAVAIGVVAPVSAAAVTPAAASPTSTSKLSPTLSSPLAAYGSAARSATAPGLAAQASTGLTPSTSLTPPDVDVAKVQADLAQLYSIAQQNGGNRQASTAGYASSLAYVKGKLQAAGYTVTQQPCSGCSGGAGDNLIAEWPHGDTSNVYMFGAHLDTVYAGPGINDNGSGSASILEAALALAQANPAMKNRVRFAWWSDEEQGENGSDSYVQGLSQTDRANIRAYYNFDMIASRNAGYFVNNITTAAAAPLKAYWDSLGLAPQENVEGKGRSDDYSFQRAGIPTSGYATGASAIKSSSEAAKWGGQAGQSYDSCYHSSCDTTSNINATALNQSVDGIAYTIWNTAVADTPPPPPGNDFSIAANPTSGTVAPGSSAAVTVSTATTSGTAQTVQLSASGAPSGVSVSFSPSSVQSGQSATATVQVASGTAGGTYTLTLTGSGAVAHSTTYTLTVSGGGGGGQTTWTAYTTYAAGDVVSYQGVNYRCLQGHTALPGWEPPNVPALWQAI